MIDGKRRRGLLGDARGRIPFALIGVLLLVSAGLFVLHAGTDSSGTVDTDADLAVDRTEAAAETAVREGTTQAIDRAAAQPLSTVSETRYGQVLDGTRPFRSYLRALIYLEVSEHLHGAGQTVDDVQTTAAVPNVTDPEAFAAGIDRVSLTPGRVAPDLEAGTLRVTVEDVLIEAKSDGERVDSHRTNVTVTVPTPLFELRDRTAEYEQQLNAGITEPGFGQRFNARIYALGWARGYAQYAGMPVTQVIANRHVIPAANDAVYRTQKDVFGAADPQLSNAVRHGWLCMAMQDAEELYGGYTSDSDGTVPGNDSDGPGVSLSEQLCRASELVFGEQATGDPPESPGVTDLLGSAPGMDAEHTVSLGETAKIPLGVMLSSSGEHSLWEAVDRIYTIETALDLSLENVEEPEFEHDPPARYTGSGSRVSLQSRDVRVWVSTIEELDEPGQFHRIEGRVSIRLRERRRFTDHGVEEDHETVTEASGRLTADFVLRLSEDEASPNANIDSYNEMLGQRPGTLEPEYKYERGPRRVDSATAPTVPGLSASEGFVNYDGVSEAVLEAIADADAGDSAGPEPEPVPVPSVSPGDSPLSEPLDNGSFSEEQIVEWLESTWEGANSTADLALASTREVDLPMRQLFRTDLKQTITADLLALQERVGDINATVERAAVVQAEDGEGPFAKLYEEVEKQRERSLSREQPYVNVGQKVVYEARYSYFEHILDELDKLEAAHGEALGALDEELGDIGLDDALSYLQQGLTAEPPDPVPMESSSLTGEVTYEVSGSPTYLVAETVTDEDVPAVRSTDSAGGDGFDPLAASNRNFLKLPYESVVDGLLNRVADLFGFGDSDAKLTFRMAGEALRAGDLSIDAAETDEYGDTRRLERLTADLEAETADAIEDFETEVASQIAFRLYPDETYVTCVIGACPDELAEYRNVDDWCDDFNCRPPVEVAVHCTTDHCRLAEDSDAAAAFSEIEQAVVDTVDSYGSTTSERAIAIDEGNLTEPISRAVATAIPQQHRPSHAAGLPDTEWQGFVSSVTEPAVVDAAGREHVSLDDTDTVEQLDTEIRQTLEAVSRDLVRERVVDRIGGSFNLSNYDDWVGGVDTPVRVPAGMPLLPLPNLWFATANAWTVEVEGEYARFAVAANQGSPQTATGLTYVREDRAVTQDIAGESRRLGRVEPIQFTGQSVLIVVVPPGGIGVGDRDDINPEESPTWPGAGYDLVSDDLGG